MPTRLLRPAFAALAIAMATAVPGAFADTGGLVPIGAAPRIDSAVPQAESTGMWFVQLEGAPVAKGGNPAKLSSEKAAFRQDASEAGISYKERFAYSKIWNGVSVSVDSPADASALSRLPGATAL